MTDYSKLEKVNELNFDNIEGKTVAIAGLGSLGSHIAEALVRSGIDLRIVDMGRIAKEDITTISLFLPTEEKKFKSKEGKKHLEKLNPKSTVKAFHEQLKENNVFLLEADVVIDCTQNWNASKLINSFCKDKKLPLIYSRVEGSNGMVLAAKGGYAHTKLEKHIEKMKGVKEVGLLPSTVHLAAAAVLSRTYRILNGDKFPDKVAKIDGWNGKISESSSI